MSTQRIEKTGLVDVIKCRRSTRGFKSEPVPKALLQAVMEAAVNAPSWANTQPWEFWVVSGEPLVDLKRELAALPTTGPFNTDLPFPQFPEKYQERYRQNGAKMRATIEAEAVAGDAWQREELFGAPVTIIVCIDRALGPYSIYDAGLATQNLLLAAECVGLGTVPLAYLARSPELLHRIVGIPESKTVICGVAIGYADPAAPANLHKSEREPTTETVNWCGVGE
jgi:nitroreductase